MIHSCLDSELSLQEEKLIKQAKTALDSNQYFPRIVTGLKTGLRPLAIQQQLSQSTKSLYQLLTSHEFHDKGLGVGLMSLGQWL